MRSQQSSSSTFCFASPFSGLFSGYISHVNQASQDDLACNSRASVASLVCFGANLLNSSSFSPRSFVPRDRPVSFFAAYFLHTSCELALDVSSNDRTSQSHSLHFTLFSCSHSLPGVASAHFVLFLHHPKRSSNFHSIDSATAVSHELPDVVSGASSHDSSTHLYAAGSSLTLFRCLHGISAIHFHHDDLFHCRTSKLQCRHGRTMSFSTSRRRTSCRKFCCTKLSQRWS